MNVLFVVPYAPQPIRVRPFELLRELRRRGHRVVVATVISSRADARAVALLMAAGVEVHAERVTAPRMALNCVLAAVRGVPLQALVCWHPRLARRLFEVLRSPVDVAHVEHLRAGGYLEALRRRLPPPVPLVWDSVDCISHLFAQTLERSRSARGRLQASVDLRRTRRYEAHLLRLVDRVLVSSATDRAALSALPGAGEPAPIDVITNGVDLARFSPPAAGARRPATLVLTGKMSYHANVSAAISLVREVMPPVWAERPDVEVRIAGRSPPAQVRRLSAGASGRVTIVGEVEDMADELRRATLAVAPIWYGAGIQNKVLEAMACATPVVASPLAAAPLAARPGEDLAIAESPAAFAREILALLVDSRRRDALGASGRRQVERDHGWSTIADRLELSYRDAIAERASRGTRERKHG